MILVTGGCGFIGRALVARLVAEGEEVRVLDDMSRGKVLTDVDVVVGDIRALSPVLAATRNVSEVIHLAFVNGTQSFYDDPYRVLDVGIRGILNVVEACRFNHVKMLTLASSSEVCRSDMSSEGDPLVIPDAFNPRYSYSAGKMISEMVAIHSRAFDRLLIFRPYNIYGPGMSQGHVVPDFVARIKQLPNSGAVSPFDILGNGDETRSFCYIDDLIDGIMLMRKKGSSNTVYNIGMPVETTIAGLAQTIAKVMGRKIEVVSGNKFREGEVKRRKPDINRMLELGYNPRISLEEGLLRTI